MNVVMRISLAFIEFVAVTTVIVLPLKVQDPIVIIWYLLCIALAFFLRIGLEYNRNTLTWKALLYQSICTISWCFFMTLVWFSFLNYGWLEIYLFVNSLFAAFMVSQFEQVFQMGFKKWLSIKLGKFLAVESKEDQL